MITPIRVAAATAVFALSGTLLLASGAIGPQPAGPAPGAATPDIPMEPAHYTGTVRAWEVSAVERQLLPDRQVERWTAAFENTMSDPRVTGLGRASDYLETIVPVDGTGVMSHTGVGRVTTDDGSWAIECHGAGSATGAEGAYIFCWFDGEAAYGGLTAFQVMTMRDEGEFDAEGWIFPGERPPLLDFEG